MSNVWENGHLIQDKVLFRFCGKKNEPGVCTECIFLLSK